MFTTPDAAKGMQRKHSKPMRDIAETAFTPDAQISPAGKRQRFFHLTRDALPFLFMGQAAKHEILRLTDAIKAL